MDRIWQAQYLPSMKKEILPLVYDSLVDIQESIKKYSDKVAYSSFGGKRTYEEESLTVEEVIAYCRKNLAAYKVPKHVEFIAEVPKSVVGKLLRRKLR